MTADLVMKKAGAPVLLLLLCFTNVWAVVGVPKLSSRVTDLTHTLSSQQIMALENKLADFERKKGSQIAVLMVPTTQPEDIAEYGIQVADLWRIGRDHIDDGIILIIAKDDRKMRLEVGYGLEGVVPDAIAKRVISETMAPFFQKGDYAGGIDAGVTQVMKLIDGEPLPPPKPQTLQVQNESQFMLLLFGGLFAGFILSALVSRITAGLLAGLGSAAAAALLFGISFAAVVIGLMIFFIVGLPHRSGVWTSGGGFGGGMGGGAWSGGGGGFGGGGASGSW